MPNPILPMAASLMMVAAATAFAQPRPTAGAAPDDATLRACVVKLARRNNYSGVISIARPGGTITHSTGQMAGPSTADITDDTQFNLGSAGKMFTAIAVAQLIDAGKVGLDDPVGRHVAGLTPEAAAVTVRQLLTHSSGLGNFFVPENLPALERARSVSDLLPLVASDKPAFLPGSRFEYSNTGFLLLGLMVERVSGEQFGDYLAKHVFAPAGMTHSGLVGGPPAMRAVGMTNLPELEPDMMMGPPPRVAPPPGAGPGPGGPPPGMMMPPPGPLRPSQEAALRGEPAGGSSSSAPDMQRFFAALMAGKLTSAAMRDQLVSSQIAVPPPPGLPPRSYGFGFGIGDVRGHRWFGHNGGTPGVNSETMVFPDDQISLVLLSNRDPPSASLLLRDLLPVVMFGAACPTD